jgi:hypothetical protein
MESRCLLVVTLVLILPHSTAGAPEPADVIPLPNAHAHNDYDHKRPLLDALDHGFCSVEADVFLVEGQLLVGHDRRELTPERNLRTLYLDALRRRVKQNSGHVYRRAAEVTLLVDFKTDGTATYKALRAILPEYDEMLTRVENAQLRKGAVTIVISGDCPREAIAADSTRYVGIDGRLSDVDSDTPSHLMPLVSDRWGSAFTWHGMGPMPPAEREKLRRIVAQAHQKGRRVRFWAIPALEDFWSELDAAGVDLINTDDLDGLRTYLLRSKR